jgi:PEP-CTERM motif
MKIRVALAASTFALTALGVNAANASTVLSDNFDSDSNVTLNWTGDATFVPVPNTPTSGKPSVDLVGNADGFGYLAYNGGVSLDLDGSTGTGFTPSGEIQSVTTLATGDYTVSFLLAGNLRGAANQTTTVSIGGQSFNIKPASSAQPYTLYTEYFTNVSGKLDFLESGLADQQGNLLDNIVVTTGVPEPATWAMFLVGFGAIGFALRRKKDLVLAA